MCLSASHLVFLWGLTGVSNVPPSSGNLLDGIKVNKDNTDLCFSEL